MKSRKIGELLRKQRKKHGWTIRDVVIRLQDRYNLNIAEKTVYGWESDQSYPRTETLLLLCELYHMEDIAEILMNDSPTGEFPITPDERNLIEQYRNHPELQSVVKRVLDVPPSDY